MFAFVEGFAAQPTSFAFFPFFICKYTFGTTSMKRFTPLHTAAVLLKCEQVSYCITEYEEEIAKLENSFSSCFLQLDKVRQVRNAHIKQHLVAVLKLLINSSVRKGNLSVVLFLQRSGLL